MCVCVSVYVCLCRVVCECVCVTVSVCLNVNVNEIGHLLSDTYKLTSGRLHTWLGISVKSSLMRSTVCTCVLI